MSRVTTLIYTRNNEHDIHDAVVSALNLTEDVTVIDQESSDKTAILAKKAGAKVISVSPVEFVELVRMNGIQNVKTEWVFILDADERITKELAKEINERVTSNEVRDTKDELGITRYKVPRKNIFAHKKWLKHGGWFPDYQTRLLMISALTAWPSDIHSTPKMTGSEGLLKNPMLHYFHGDLEGMVNKTTKYEAIEAGLLFEAKRKSGTLIFFRKFLGELYRRLVKNAGWRDGTVGIIESVYQAYSKTITYLYLYEKQQSA